jgi:hypothetical protein
VELANQKKPATVQPARARFAIAIALLLALALGSAIAFAMKLLMHGPLATQSLPSDHQLVVIAGLVAMALLLAILLILGGIFMLLAMLLCKCGCGCGGEKSLLQLLAGLLPGLTAGLRAGAKAFDAGANAAHASVAPLHTAGSTLQNTVGPALQQINVPSASLPNKLLWDVLHDLHLVHGAAPDFMSSIWVLTGVTLDTSSPFAGPNGLGTQVTATGSDLEGASDRAAGLEGDLRAGARGLRAVATAIDGQP